MCMHSERLSNPQPRAPSIFAQKQCADFNSTSKPPQDVQTLTTLRRPWGTDGFQSRLLLLRRGSNPFWGLILPPSALILVVKIIVERGQLDLLRNRSLFLLSALPLTFKNLLTSRRSLVLRGGGYLLLRLRSDVLLRGLLLGIENGLLIRVCGDLWGERGSRSLRCKSGEEVAESLQCGFVVGIGKWLLCKGGGFTGDGFLS
ncbi:hypothetical protein TGRH88_048860 [Toxoplasma gondii]|uniref:Uncharacterized protein n=1 Tax=Toxoplasma gondii TaxID=5811 RepID=A0A7J6JVA1_TOXGO|nr:hypothetical protein TGRH88_048860 [Toxoplasma gondii]